jgi:TPR repeat protein
MITLAMLLILLILTGIMWVDLSYSKELKRKAEAGDMEAQFNLALCYQTGTGIKVDKMATRFWLSKAAGQGHAEAVFLLTTKYGGI